MELKWLHDFVSLANTGNFSRSAEERNVTQSAFSRRIQSLEHWLDTELVDRKTHPVSLTDSGIRFLKPAKNMIRQAERMQDDFHDARIDDRNILTFTSSTNLAISFLPRWLTEIQSSFGKFGVKVQTDISGVHDHFEALRNKQSDFLLHYGHGVGLLAMDANKFDYKVVGNDRLVPVCHRSLYDSISSFLSENSKKPLPYISPWRTSSIAHVIAEKIAQNHPTLRLDPLVESSIVGCTKGYVSQGVGIAWIPTTAIEEELQSGEFRQLFDESFEIPLSIELFRYVSGGNAVADRFWEFVEETPD